MTVKYLLGVSAIALTLGFGGSAFAQNTATANSGAKAVSDDAAFKGVSAALAASKSVAKVDDSDTSSSYNTDIHATKDSYNDNSKNLYVKLDDVGNDKSVKDSYNTSYFTLNATVAVADQDLKAEVSSGSTQHTLWGNNYSGDANVGEGAFGSAAGVVNVPISTGLGNASANGVNIAATASFHLGN